MRAPEIVWTPELNDAVWSRYIAGMSTPEIAREFEFTNSQINNRLYKLRSERPERSAEAWTLELDQTVWAMYLEKRTVEDIARTIGRSFSVTKNRVFTLRKNHEGVKIERGLAPKNRERVWAEWLKGELTEKEITEKLGLDRDEVRIFLIYQRTLHTETRRNSPELSPFEVNVIRLLLEGGMIQQKVADKFGCSREAISAIATTRNSAKVPDYLEILRNARKGQPENG